MMSEARLPASSSADDDLDKNAIQSALSEETNDNSATGRVGENLENNEYAAYPTVTSSKSDLDNDTTTNNSAQISGKEPVGYEAMQNQDYESQPQDRENQIVKKKDIHNINNKNDLNSIQPTDTDRNTVNNASNIKNHVMSAPMSVLGANSDRSDFFRGGETSNGYTKSSEEEMTTNTSSTLGKMKSWFVGGDNGVTDDGSDALDYHEFTSPAQKKKKPPPESSDDYIEGDVEMATNGRSHKYNDDEEYVMEKCSFAYGSESPEKYKSPHKVPSIDQQYSNEANDNDELGSVDSNHEYFGNGQKYQNRRINPKAMAHAITSRAKRTWTERRYRRRLRQSQFIPPNNTITDDDDRNEHSLSSPNSTAPSSFHYELTSEHRYAFHAAHAALNGKLASEEYRNRHANLREVGYDNDLQFDLEQANNGEEEVRADLTKSSLAIRGGQIRLPVDNVRLVCDEYLQPGILSIETRDMGGGSGGGTKGYEMFGNANRYGNIYGSMMRGIGDGGSKEDSRQRSEKLADVWERHELAYVLTVDDHIYRRVAQEMGDANQVPCGIYFCCHETGGGGNHVGIEVAVLILLVIFFLLVAGMIVWPTW